MKFFFIRITLLFLLLISNIVLGKAQQNKQQSQYLDSICISTILEHALPKSKESSKYIIASHYICSGCIEQMVNKLSKLSIQNKEVGIILINSNEYTIRKWNILYRGKLHFAYCDTSIVHKINYANKSFLSRAFFAVQVTSEKKLQFFSGFEYSDNLEECADWLIKKLLSL
jgi:hypothetical protein